MCCVHGDVCCVHGDVCVVCMLCMWVTHDVYWDYPLFKSQCGKVSLNDNRHSFIYNIHHSTSGLFTLENKNRKGKIKKKIDKS